MLCPSCHTDNIEGADLCTNCGADLTAVKRPKPGPAQDFMHDRLADLPAARPSRVGPTDPVGLAVRLMQTEGVGCVFVMDDERLAGIITGWDILHKVAGPEEDLNAVACRDVMTADPVCLREDDTIAVAINKMAIGEFRHIPLLLDGKPIRVIGVDDIFRHIHPYLV